MKKVTFLVFLTIVGLHVFAQSEETEEIQQVFDACISFRNAVWMDDADSIRLSAVVLQQCKMDEFGSLTCDNEGEQSINGHLLFDAEFADSLSNDRSILLKSNEFAERQRETRGQTQDGSILTKTCFVKAGGTGKYRFTASGHQELGVVAEAGGRVTMRIHVTNEDGLDKRYDDREDVKKGRPQRKVAFEMPKEGLCTVELEVVNCSGKDISFVVISN